MSITLIDNFSCSFTLPNHYLYLLFLNINFYWTLDDIDNLFEIRIKMIMYLFVQFYIDWESKRKVDFYENNKEKIWAK